MAYLILAFAGLLIGSVVTFLLLESKRKAALDALAQAKLLHSEGSSLKADADRLRTSLAAGKSELDGRIMTLEARERENRRLKQDLFNLGVEVRRLDAERTAQDQRQTELDAKGRELAERYLEETRKWIAQGINANNYTASRQRLTKAIEWVRSIGYPITTEQAENMLTEVKRDYEAAVRAAVAREEQARIKAQIREEEMRQREIQRELDAIAREREAIRVALEKALADAKGQHNAEVAQLEARLREAEARNQRAISQAQLTKAGHVYVISNIGSFGRDRYKIGMTRRLTPQDRVDELGDASVPFPFDVHMMISCQDAPALERAIHSAFEHARINRINPRKEFFQVTFDEIRAVVEKHHGKVDYVLEPEALEYRQSLTATPEDQEVIDRAFEDAEARLGVDTRE